MSRTTSRARSALTRLPGVVAAVAFVFAPVGAALFGVQATPLENRPLAEKPSLDAGWDLFDDASAYVSDHLPIRSAAVDAHGNLVRSVFRQPVEVATVTVDGMAFPRVVQGKGSWLFYGGDFMNTCSPQEGVQQSVDRLERIAKAVRASGREVAIVVAPDKSTVVADQLPGRYIGRLCSTERKRAFWQEYTTRGGDLLDIRADLAEAMKADGGAYLQSDSHWTPRGGTVFARKLVGHLDPSVWRDSDIAESGTRSKAGDLAPLLLEERTDVVPNLERRTGWSEPTGKKTARYDVHYRQKQAPGSRLVGGRTALVGDSFTLTSRDQWLPWFSDVKVRHRLQSKPDAILDAIVDSDHVVIEAVERDVASGRNGPLNDALVAELERRLRAEKR